jgi:RHS repeat-associated protein
VWLGSTPIAMFTPDPANAANPPLIFYVHADHLDTPRVVVDRSNNLRWRWMAEPFGTTAPENNPSGLGNFTQNLRFPGQYFDQESGLQDNWHRSYDSTLGRYTTFDPIGLAGGINGFAYVNGNPIGLSDLLGLAAHLGGGACANAITSSDRRSRDEVIREILFALRGVPGLEPTGEPKLGPNWETRRGRGVPIKPEIQVVLIVYDIEFVKYKTFRITELFQHLLTWCKYKTRDQCGNEGEETQYSESNQIVPVSRDLVDERFSSERFQRWRSVPFPLPW